MTPGVGEQGLQAVASPLPVSSKSLGSEFVTVLTHSRSPPQIQLNADECYPQSLEQSISRRLAESPCKEQQLPHLPGFD